MKFYGWKLLAGLSVIYFLAVGTTFYGIGVVLPPMIKELGWSRTEASTGFALLTVVLGMSGPLVAILIRRVGVRATMVAGGLISFSGGVLTYYTQSIAQFYLGAGILMGLGMAMQTVIPSTLLVTNWFVRKRSLAMGIFMAAGGVGAFMAAPMSVLIESTGEWRFVWLVMGGAALFASFVAALVVKGNPGDVGQYPDGFVASLLSDSDALETSSQRVYQTAVDWNFKAALCSSSFWYIIIGSSIAVLGATIINSQLVLHITNIGLSPLLAGTAMGLQGSMGALGRLTSGGLGDVYDPKKILALGLMGEAIGVLLLSGADSTLWVYASAIVFGLCFGLTVVATSTLIANFYGIRSNANLMAIRGMVVTLLAASGPISAAYIADTTGSYTTAFYIYVCLAGLASLLIFAMPLPKPSAKIGSAQVINR